MGILPNVPGFLTTTNLVSPGNVWPWLSDIYHYAWFVGFIVSGFVYVLLMRNESKSLRQNDFSLTQNEAQLHVGIN